MHLSKLYSRAQTQRLFLLFYPVDIDDVSMCTNFFRSSKEEKMKLCNAIFYKSIMRAGLELNKKFKKVRERFERNENDLI